MYNNSGVNKVFLVGHVENQPRLHKNNNKPGELCFTLTTAEHIRKGDTPLEHIEHHHIIISSAHSDIKDIELKKGLLIYLTGRIQTRSWIDEYQVKRYKTEVFALQLQVLCSGLHS